MHFFFNITSTDNEIFTELQTDELKKALSRGAHYIRFLQKDSSHRRMGKTTLSNSMKEQKEDSKNFLYQLLLVTYQSSLLYFLI